MIWIDNIQDLQYYNQPKGVPCYCDAIAYPFDMYLQGQIYNGNGSYTLNIYVYSADGLTQYENATAYFDYYFSVVPGAGHHIFNARLKSFSPAMCAHECYILRAVVVQSGGVTVFDKYTERYCQNNCCDVARNIAFDQVGFSPNIVNEGNDPTAMELGNDVTVAGITPYLYIPSGNCGEQLLRIIAKFDCIDNFTGDFYGAPDVVLSGTANFQYRKITTLRGRIVRRPREISREISYNCKVQRVESAPQYLLEGFEYLPPWKMYEIEGQLHANRIFIDDSGGVREYRYAGGTPMKQVSKCFELFKLEATLEDCMQRQVFGCTPGCSTLAAFDGSNVIFAIPANYAGGAFYNSNKQMVATDADGLIDYFRTRSGAMQVNDIAMDDMQCSAYKVLGITSTGLIDTHIYFDAPIATNKVYGVTVNDINDLCSNLPRICIAPVAGLLTVTIPVCIIPVAGAFTVEEIDTDTVNLTGYNNWVADAVETSGMIYNNEVTFSLKVVNDTITEDPAYPEEDVLINEIIGIMGSHGRPSTMVVLNSGNSALADGVTITIDNYGRITYYGNATTAAEDDVTIDLNNLTYTI